MMLSHCGKFPRTYKWVGLTRNLVVVGGQGVVPKRILIARKLMQVACKHGKVDPKNAMVYENHIF